MNLIYKNTNYQAFELELFQGIKLYYFFCEGSYTFQKARSCINDILGINYCYQGGFEATLKNKKHIYRGAKEATLSLSDNFHTESRIPHDIYEAISISIFLPKLPNYLSRFFMDMGIDFRSLIKKFNLKHSWYSLPPSPEFQKLFEDIYFYMENQNINMIKAAFILLLTQISSLDFERFSSNDYIPSKYSRLIMKIANKLEQRENYKIPVEKLVSDENISYSLFLKLFKEIYKLPPSRYRRNHRMNDAAYLLKHSNKSIAEISAICAYDNSGKFAAAFKKTTGMSPNSYRQHESAPETANK